MLGIRIRIRVKVWFWIRSTVKIPDLYLGGPWTLTTEAWRVGRPVVAESHHCVEDPDLSDSDPQTWVQPTDLETARRVFLENEMINYVSFFWYRTYYLELCIIIYSTGTWVMSYVASF
jgi:hypothetical protein